jgi:hypothetical protein
MLFARSIPSVVTFVGRPPRFSLMVATIVTRLTEVEVRLAARNGHFNGDGI